MGGCLAGLQSMDAGGAQTSVLVSKNTYIFLIAGGAQISASVLKIVSGALGGGLRRRHESDHF